jgi:putative phosphoribosyl transferase
LFKDRAEAGRLLAESLDYLKAERDNVVILAIPRGGVVVAKEIADSLNAPLDLVVSRKIPAPGEPELAIGAVTQDGDLDIDKDLVRALHVTEEYIREESASQLLEIKRRLKEYRGDRPFPVVDGKTVVVVDDGIATGSTIRAAIRSLRKRKAGRVILAVPVGPESAVKELSSLADQVACLEMPEPFFAIGQFYRDFDQVDDATVRSTLASRTHQPTG